MYYKTTYKSPLGILYLVSDEENLIGLWLEGQKYFQATLKEEPIINDQIKILQETKSWLERYFKGEKMESYITEGDNPVHEARSGIAVS